MNELLTRSQQSTIESREVAEMLDMEHWQLLRKLEGSESAKVVGAIPTFTNNGIVVSDYFLESAYIDNSGKQNKCYLFTKLGCDFIANKFTGEKGVLFSAKYVKRFNEMDQTIKSGLLDGLSTEMKALLIHDKKIQAVENKADEANQKADAINDDLQSFKLDLPLLGVELDKITAAVHTKGVACLGGKETPAYHEKSLRSKVYADIYREIKRQFGVSSYKAIKRNQCEIAIDIINSYAPPIVIRDEIDAVNAQLFV